MNNEENNKYYYSKISKAIAFIDTNFKEQPTLDEIASHIHLSPFHFQRLFKEWVGISPKKYLQFISSIYAKSLLRKKDKNMFDFDVHPDRFEVKTVKIQIIQRSHCSHLQNLESDQKSNINSKSKIVYKSLNTISREIGRS